MADVERLRAVLTGASLVHIDACVFALHARRISRYVPLTRTLLSALGAGEVRAQTSAITVYQLLAEPYRRGREDLAQRAESCLAGMPLTIVPVSVPVARQAALVRTQLGGSLDRAIQISTGLATGAEIFMTQRSALRRVAGMRVESLESFAGREG